MKPPPFDYVRPVDIAEALEALASGGDDAKVIAGGQSLVPMLNLRLAHPTLLVDINRLGIGGISADDGLVRIGGMTRQSELLESRVIRRAAPVIAEATQLVGHPAIRNRGTLGGSLCHADPTAELAAVALLLDATLDLESRGGSRTVSAGEFFLGPFTTAILPDELLVAVSFRAQPPDDRFAFIELSERSGDFAVASVAVRFSMGDGVLEDPAVVLAGAAGVPLRSAAAETVLRGAAPSDQLFGDAAEAATAHLEPQADIRASADFRRHLLRVLVARALAEATSGASQRAH